MHPNCRCQLSPFFLASSRLRTLPPMPAGALRNFGRGVLSRLLRLTTKTRSHVMKLRYHQLAKELGVEPEAPSPQQRPNSSRSRRSRRPSRPGCARDFHSQGRPGLAWRERERSCSWRHRGG